MKGNTMNRIILDTETLGDVTKPKTLRVYDFAFIVVDDKFNTVHSYRALVSETWHGQFGPMTSAYYARKLPQYYEQLAHGELTIKPMLQIWHEFNAIVKTYNVKQVWAYNASFDKHALNETISACSNGFRKHFTPYGVKWHCIQHVAAQTIMNTKRYFKFITLHNCFTGKGNPKSSAEVAFAYLTKNPSYYECHTALEDSIIEAQILKACYSKARHDGKWGKLDKNPNRNCWSIVKRNYNAWLEN